MFRRTGNSKFQRTHGFTLVELLVVIAIISLLVALLLPALAKAKFASEHIECTARMRQMTLAVRMYTDANRSYFPPMAAWGYNYGSWFSQIAPYQGFHGVTTSTSWRQYAFKTMQCPTRVTGVWTYGYPHWLYCMPWPLFYNPSIPFNWGGGTEIPQRADLFKKPSKLGVVLDGGVYASAIHPPHVDTYGIYGHPSPGIAPPNHGGRGLSSSYLDGHAIFTGINHPYSYPTVRPPWWLKSFWQVPGSWGQTNGYND